MPKTAKGQRHCMKLHLSATSPFCKCCLITAPTFEPDESTEGRCFTRRYRRPRRFRHPRISRDGDLL